MLTLTENAMTIVDEITARPGLTEDAGLRITQVDAPEPAFEVSAAAHGQPDDQVVEQGGATVYLDPASAALLDDKVLDAAVDPTGKVEFALAQQG
jgi:iron-sulfur cluster assembly protein